DRLSCWARQVAERRGKHKAVGAIANKMARISWALMYYQQSYRSA
ncbi:MAG TPA: IS110 family transposase, partial [Alcanivorax sp.]|nr:IS110 family transposase [Alcanivorax sp.]